MTDSGLRLRSVRLKPHVIADGLLNVLSGLGTTADSTYANRYWFQPLGPEEIEAAYRGSGMMRKVVDVPAFDAVREGRDWQADDEQIELLEAEEARLGLHQKLLLAEIMRGLGGGAMILGVPGEPGQPAPTSIGKGKLAFIQVVNRWQLQARDWVTDPTLEGYGGPKMWQVSTATGLVDIHPSRVVAFRGDPLPNLSGATDDDLFWGESRIQRVMGAVKNSDLAQQSFAALVSKARSTIIGVPDLSDTMSTAEGRALLRTRVGEMMQLESIFNAVVRDAGNGEPGAGETIEHRQVTWAGIRDVMFAFATFVAGLADIPVTRLLGQAAEGMNASGDSQQKDYAKTIKAKQELFLRPCLERIDEMLIPSALGKRPPEIWFKFAPLDTPTEKEESERFKTVSEALKNIGELAVMPAESFNEAAQNTLVESGFMPGLDTALAKIPDDQRFGLAEEEDDGTDPSALQAEPGKEPEPTVEA